METDRWLIQYVKDTTQVRAQLRSQSDSLGFSAAQCFRRAAKGKIAEAHLLHETQSLVYFRYETDSDCLMRSPELQPVNRARCFAGRKIRELIDRVTLDTHVAGHGAQTRAVTARAFARFAFLDPFRFALGSELGFQNRFTVCAGSGLQILIPNFAESAAFFAHAVRRIKRKQTRIKLLERAATVWAAHFGADDCNPAF